jgi:hypothetical protein
MVFLLNMDFNPYIPQIERFAKEQLGQDISIGKISLSVFRGFSIKVENFVWQSNYSEHLMLQLKHFHLRLRLLPLLTGGLDISGVYLDEPFLTFVKLARKDNLMKPAVKTVSKSAVPLQPAAPETVPVKTVRTKKHFVFPLRSFNLSSFQIHKGTVIYQDDTSPQARRVKLENINLGLGFSKTLQQFPIKGSAHFESYPIAVTGFVGSLQDPVSRKFLPFKDIPFRVELTADNLSLRLIQAFFPQWTKSLEAARIQGSENFTFLVEGTPSSVRLNFFQDVTEQSIAAQDLFTKAAHVPAEIRLGGRYGDSNKFLVEKFQLTLGEMQLKASGEIDPAGSTLDSLKAEIPPFSLSGLGKFFPKILDWKLGGDLSLEFKADRFNWLSHQGDLEGSLRIDQLSVLPKGFKIPLQSNRLVVTWDETNLLLKPVLLSAAGGSAQLSGEISDYWKDAHFSLRGDLDKVDLERTFVPLPKNDVSITGTGSGQLRFEGDNPEPQFWKKTLRGDFNLLIEKGSIRNFNFVRNLNLLEELSVLTSQIPFLANIMPKSLQKILFRQMSSPDTDFEKALVVGEASEGILYFKKIALLSPQMEVTGTGEYRLEKDEFKFAGKLTFSAQETDDLVHMANEFESFQDDTGRVYFPFTISGKGNEFKVMVVKEFLFRGVQDILLKQGSRILKVPQQAATTGTQTAGTAVKTSRLDQLIQYGLDQILNKGSQNGESEVQSPAEAQNPNEN